MEIRELSINDIDVAEYNPREIKEENFEGLKKSLDKFGLVEPLVWNKRNKRLIGGHQRLSAMIEKGLEKVWVSVVDFDETDEKALNVILNSGKIQGQYVNDKLNVILDELRLTLPSEDYDGLRLREVEPVEVQELPPGDYGKKNVEFSANTFGGDLKHTCPKCGFEFGE